MRATVRGWATGVCVALLALSLVGSTAAAGTSAVETGSATAPSALTQSSADTIELTESYALTPARPGAVTVTLTYAIPDRVSSLTATLPGDATVTDTDGFESVNATTYEWDGTTETATVELRVDPNETTDRTGREAAAGDYVFVDAGEWALFDRVQTGASWRYSSSPGEDPVSFEQSATTDGPGATGDQLVYLGAVSTVERTANGQTFRLVVPDRAELAEPREAILDSLANASESLSVGDRDETVTVVAAPTDEVAWGVRGLELGGSDFYVRDLERLEDPSNVWLHEYVHTRQAFTTTRETRWLTEGTAVYYAALLTLEQGHVDFETFAEFMDDGARSSYDDTVLSEPSTWATNANYVKGPLVAGRIDEAMRAETNATATFEDVVERINDGRVTQDGFLTAVRESGGPSAQGVAAEYTETSATVSMWDDATHSRLFGQLPADVSYALPNGTSGYRVSGPFRNDTVGTAPIQLATGETLTAEAVVRNDGGTGGEYNATLAVDGTVVDSETGTVAAAGERVVPLAHTFTEAGTYTVGVGSETVTVTVSDPAAPTVTTLSAASERVRLGENTTVTATVRNDAGIPANGTVVLTRSGEPVSRWEITLAPGNETTLSVPVSFPDAGEIPVASGSATPVTVTVYVPTMSPTATPPVSTTGGDGPGFTAPGAVLAVLVALVVRRR